MTRGVYQNFAVDSNGDTISAAQVEVRDTDGNLLTLFEAETGTATISNPITAGDGDPQAKGYFEFYVDPQLVDITIGTGASATTVRRLVSGNMGAQNADAVAITGGSANGMSVGLGTPAPGAFTRLSAQEVQHTVVELSGTTPTINCEAGALFTLALTGDTTISFSNAAGVGVGSIVRLLLTGGALPAVDTTYDITRLNSLYDTIFDAAPEVTDARSVAVSDDGTKLYVSSSDDATIYQYTMADPYFIASASYDTVSFNASAQESLISALFFGDGGTKMYISGFTNDSVHQYTLSTAWDVSTATFDSSLNVSSEDTSPQAVFLKPDGTKLYVGGSQGDEVYQYTLSTAWDLSTASYDSVSFSGSRLLSLRGFAFSDDGTKLFLSDDARAEIIEHALSTAWDLSTATSAPERDQDIPGVFSPRGITFANGGRELFVVNNDTVVQFPVFDTNGPYALSQVEGATASATFDPSAQSSTPDGLALNDDGTKAYVVDADTVYQYSLSTAWDISTASYDSVSLNASAQDNDLVDAFFGDSGAVLYLVGLQNDSVYEYSLSTAFDLSTASFVTSLSVSSEDTAPRGVAFKGDGTKMFMVGDTGNAIFQYTLSTAWDLTTASYDSVSFDLPSANDSPRGIAFKDDGSRVFILDGVDDTIYEYQLATAWNFGDSVRLFERAAPSEDLVALTGLAFGNGGAELYLIHTNGFNQYSSSAGGGGGGPFSVSYSGTLLWAGGTQPADPNDGETDLLEFINIDGGTNWYGWQVADAFPVP